jgi:hypothetical protein
LRAVPRATHSCRSWKGIYSSKPNFPTCRCGLLWKTACEITRPPSSRQSIAVGGRSRTIAAKRKVFADKTPPIVMTYRSPPKSVKALFSRGFLHSISLL